MLASREETDYGLGWMLDRSARGRTHAAGEPCKPNLAGWLHVVRDIPERGIVVAVASNTSFANTRSIALSIAQAFAQRE